MTKNIRYPVQSPQLIGQIEASHQRCRKAGIPRFEKGLPPISQEMKSRCSRHISRFTSLVYESSPEYYERLSEMLESAGAVIYYIADNFDVCGRYGNKALKDELKSINLSFGANLSEDIIGTSAASLSRLGEEGVWCIGRQNYAEILQPYAFFGFAVPSRMKEFEDFVHVLLVTRIDNLSEETLDLFRLIESTEAVHSSGVVAEFQAVNREKEHILPINPGPKIHEKPHPKNGTRYCFDNLIGLSDRFRSLKDYARRIAEADCTVLIEGESGTGKELFAQSIHNASCRAAKPFVSINCGAIPRELISSELFGYVGGAFTGASRSGAKGKFELAEGGTLFLDEIAELPYDVQCVLLRVLEERCVTRIGGSSPIPVNVRVIAATNKDMQQYIKENKFRLDLYYRLNIISLRTIPLRERPEDIPNLLDSFIIKFSQRYSRQINGISDEAMSFLKSYSWPGNVREMRNMVERGVITSSGGIIEKENLVPDFSPALAEETKLESMENSFRRRRVDIARKLMLEYRGNKSKVAKEMGIARTTLYRILEEEDI